MQATAFSLMLSPKSQPIGNASTASTVDSTQAGAFHLSLAAQMHPLDDTLPPSPQDLTLDDLAAWLAEQMEGELLPPGDDGASLSMDQFVDLLGEQISIIQDGQPTLSVLAHAVHNALSGESTNQQPQISWSTPNLAALSTRIAEILQSPAIQTSLPTQDVTALSVRIAEILQSPAIQTSLPTQDVTALSTRIAEILQSPAIQTSLPTQDMTALSVRIAEILQSPAIQTSLPTQDVTALSTRIAEILQSPAIQTSLPTQDVTALSTRIAEILQSPAIQTSLPTQDMTALSVRVAEILQAKTNANNLPALDVAALSARSTDTLSQTTLPTPSLASSIIPTAGNSLTAAQILNLDTPLNQPGWDRALGNRLQWMVNQNVQIAELKLNPPHLGQLAVRVRMEGDRAHIHFVAPMSTVREALELALPRLREMFADGKLELGDVTVSHQGAEQGGNHSQAERGSAGSGNTTEDNGIADETLLAPRTRSHDGLVDYYA